MYSKILLPIDLAHAEKMEKAIVTAVEVAKAHDARLTMIGVTGEEPGSAILDRPVREPVVVIGAMR